MSAILVQSRPFRFVTWKRYSVPMNASLPDQIAPDVQRRRWRPRRDPENPNHSVLPAEDNSVGGYLFAQERWIYPVCQFGAGGTPEWRGHEYFIAPSVPGILVVADIDANKLQDRDDRNDPVAPGLDSITLEHTARYEDGTEAPIDWYFYISRVRLHLASIERLVEHVTGFLPKISLASDDAFISTPVTIADAGGVESSDIEWLLPVTDPITVAENLNHAYQTRLHALIGYLTPYDEQPEPNQLEAQIRQHKYNVGQMLESMRLQDSEDDLDIADDFRDNGERDMRNFLTDVRQTIQANAHAVEESAQVLVQWLGGELMQFASQSHREDEEEDYAQYIHYFERAARDLGSSYVGRFYLQQLAGLVSANGSAGAESSDVVTSTEAAEGESTRPAVDRDPEHMALIGQFVLPEADGLTPKHLTVYRRFDSTLDNVVKLWQEYFPHTLLLSFRARWIDAANAILTKGPNKYIEVRIVTSRVSIPTPLEHLSFDTPPRLEVHLNEAADFRRGLRGLNKARTRARIFIVDTVNVVFKIWKLFDQIERGDFRFWLTAPHLAADIADLLGKMFKPKGPRALVGIQVAKIGKAVFDMIGYGLDAYDRARFNDYDAAAGALTAFVGMGLVLVSTITGAAVLGFVGYLFAGIGLIILICFTDNPMETFVKHCYWGEFHGQRGTFLGLPTGTAAPAWAAPSALGRPAPLQLWKSPLRGRSLGALRSQKQAAELQAKSLYNILASFLAEPSPPDNSITFQMGVVQANSKLKMAWTLTLQNDSTAGFNQTADMRTQSVVVDPDDPGPDAARLDPHGRIVVNRGRRVAITVSPWDPVRPGHDIKRRDVKKIEVVARLDMNGDGSPEGLYPLRGPVRRVVREPGVLIPPSLESRDDEAPATEVTA